MSRREPASKIPKHPVKVLFNQVVEHTGTTVSAAAHYLGQLFSATSSTTVSGTAPANPPLDLCKWSDDGHSADSSSSSSSSSSMNSTVGQHCPSTDSDDDESGSADLEDDDRSSMASFEVIDLEDDDRSSRMASCEVIDEEIICITNPTLINGTPINRTPTPSLSGDPDVPFPSTNNKNSSGQSNGQARQGQQNLAVKNELPLPLLRPKTVRCSSQFFSLLNSDAVQSAPSKKATGSVRS